VNFSKAQIDKIIIHQTGNKLREENYFLSENLFRLDEKIEQDLLYFFLKPFITQQDFYSFRHASNLELNEIYSFAKEIFSKKNEQNFIDNSKSIAKHLYENSLHPKIMSGETAIVFFKNIFIDNQAIEALGIYKSEKKDSFLKVIKKDHDINLVADNGINMSKLEKGCLVLNLNSEKGYQVLNIDIHQKITEYWMTKFLNIALIKNDQYKTEEVIQLLHNFTNDYVYEHYDKEKICNFTNKVIDYFESSDRYSFNELVDKVFLDNNDLKQDFIEYKYSKKEFDINLEDSFEISRDTVKKHKKKFRNLIKLDTNIELKILPSHDEVLLEKGYDDDKKMYFYKVYFNEELN